MATADDPNKNTYQTDSNGSSVQAATTPVPTNSFSNNPAWQAYITTGQPPVTAARSFSSNPAWQSYWATTNSGSLIQGSLNTAGFDNKFYDTPVTNNTNVPVTESDSTSSGNKLTRAAEDRKKQLADEAAAQQKALEASLRRQASVREQQQERAANGDWRVRLSLAPGADYLYDDPNPGLLAPLSSSSGTSGVIFPYMPQITTAYHATYSQYDLTHANHRGYFYQGSAPGEIQLTATFTAQDTKEAEYLLAVVHFFRSVTKMFYGQDTERGVPPPMVFLQGLGQYQFNFHPCVVRDFNFIYPNDVDYIRAFTPELTNSVGLQVKRTRNTAATNTFSNAVQRLAAAGLSKGGINIPPAAPILGTKEPTYVPTRADISLTLLPMQSRKQVSEQFALRKYSNGSLYRGGFW